MEIRTQFDNFQRSMDSYLAEQRSMKQMAEEILLSLTRLEQRYGVPPQPPTPPDHQLPQLHQSSPPLGSPTTPVHSYIQPFPPSSAPRPADNNSDVPPLLLSPSIIQIPLLLPTPTRVDLPSEPSLLPIPSLKDNRFSDPVYGALPAEVFAPPEEILSSPPLPTTPPPISLALQLHPSAPSSLPESLFIPLFPELPDEIHRELICDDSQSDFMGLCLGDEIPAEPPPIASPTAVPPSSPSAATEGASSVVEDVIESAQNGCPGLSILQSGPCLRRFMLELPESSFVLGTCKKKKDDEHDAALKALDQLRIHPSKDNPTSEEVGERLVSRSTYLFSDKFLASQLPMSGHLRATLRRERDPHSTYLIGLWISMDLRISRRTCA